MSGAGRLRVSHLGRLGQVAVLLTLAIACQTPEQKGRRDYSFSADWFSYYIPLWTKELAQFRGKPNVRYLEIGVYEGRSAIWVLENILTHDTAELTGIDIFPGNLKQRYLANLAQTGVARKTITIQGDSRTELRKLPPESYDIIYIDGSHAAEVVLADAVQSWFLLRLGGLLIFDDYGWSAHLPAEARPRVAIDAFITTHRSHLAVVHRDHQVIVKKVPSPCDAFRPEEYEIESFCSPVGQYVYHWKERRLMQPKTGVAISISVPERDAVESFLRSRPFGSATRDIDPTLEDNPTLRALWKQLESDQPNQSVVR